MLTGESVDWFEAVAWQASKLHEMNDLHAVVVAIDDTKGFMIKLNDGPWSAPYGAVTTDDEGITAEEEPAWSEWR